MNSQFNFYEDIEFAILCRHRILYIYIATKALLCKYKDLLLNILSENYCEESFSVKINCNFRKHTNLKAPGEREGCWKLKTISRRDKAERGKRNPKGL